MTHNYYTMPLKNQEFALLRTVIGRFSQDAERLVARLEAQGGNPIVDDGDRRIYVLAPSDVEAISVALCTAIATAPSPVYRQRLVALLEWMRRQIPGLPR